MNAFTFAQLLASWNRREDARSAGDFRRLANARIDLENARTQVRSSFGSPR